MAKVTGLGGIFFKSRDPEKTREWYNKHLGIEHFSEHGVTFEWRKAEKPGEKGYSVMSAFGADTDYMEPGTRDFMINLRVDDLEGMIEQMKKEGIRMAGEIEVYEYGKFCWVVDPNGIKIELWEPDDAAYGQLPGDAVKSE